MTSKNEKNKLFALQGFTLHGLSITTSTNVLLAICAQNTTLWCIGGKIMLPWYQWQTLSDMTHVSYIAWVSP